MVTVLLSLPPAMRSKSKWQLVSQLYCDGKKAHNKLERQEYMATAFSRLAKGMQVLHTVCNYTLAHYTQY
jgi:hypothetical protein